MWRMEDSHKWVTIPHTVYERTREMRVRESRHTFMMIDQKYYDHDTNKYITDKLKTINSYSLHEIACDDDYPTYYPSKLYKGHYEKKLDQTVRRFDKFIPKDDDFDKECRRDEEEANRKYHDQLCIQQQIESARLKENYEREQREQRERLTQEAINLANIKETEIRITYSYGQYDSPKNMSIMSNIRPNCWRPK